MGEWVICSSDLIEGLISIFTPQDRTYEQMSVVSTQTRFQDWLIGRIPDFIRVMEEFAASKGEE